MIRISLDSPVPLVEQLQLGIRSAIASEILNPGDLLPPVRQLAGDLGINLNTVARAYRALESDGLVATARGRGTRVTASSDGLSEAEAQEKTRAAMRKVIIDARLGGVSLESLKSLLDELAQEYYEKEKSRG